MIHLDQLCCICFWKYSFLTFRSRLSTQFLCILCSFVTNLSFFFNVDLRIMVCLQVCLLKGLLFPLIVFLCNAKRFAIAFLFFPSYQCFWMDWLKQFVYFSSIFALDTCDQYQTYYPDMLCAFKRRLLEINS